MWFKRKKIYCVRWADVCRNTHQDIVVAKNIGHAWAKIQKNYYAPQYCYSITEVNPNNFPCKREDN